MLVRTAPCMAAREHGSWNRRLPSGEGPRYDSSGPLSLLRLQDEVRAPVEAPALLVVLGALRLLLAVADHVDPARDHAVGGEEIPGGMRPAIAERQVVRLGPALVTVSLDEHGSVGVPVTPLRRRLQRLRVLAPDRGLVEVEVDVRE